MLSSLFFKYRWKQLILQVWKNRLLEQWQSIEPSICPWVNCSLHVSWGLFYNGAVLIDRRFKHAKIIVQMPYDGYLTTDDQKILSQFSISKNVLPYFIYFHNHVIYQSIRLQPSQGISYRTQADGIINN